MAKDPICGMPIDEKTGLKLKKDGKFYYFCSEHCLAKFAKENKFAEKEIQAACLIKPETPFCKNKTTIIASILGFVVLLSYIFDPLLSFRRLWY